MTPANFDSIARAYQWLELFSFGSLLQKCRTEYLAELANCRNALVLGDGDGRFTEQLLHTNRQGNVLAVDGSAAMLALLRSRTQKAGNGERVKTFQQDIRELSVQGSFDLVVSHFFLDCLTAEEFKLLQRDLAALVQPSALWVISEFALPKRGLRKTLGGVVIRVLYLIFRWMTRLETQRLPDYEPILQQGGWKLEKQRLRLGGLLKSQLWQLSPQEKSNRMEQPSVQERV